MLAWRVHRYGRPSDALVLDDIPVPEPGPGQVRIAVRATALNFNDVDGCYGRYRTVHPPLPYTLGMEVTGRVEAAGAGAEGWIGKRVMATPENWFGGYAEYVVAPLDMTFEVPDGLTDEQAAAFFYPFHLAYLGLFERGRLQAGETVLVHAAAGGVGSAAVQLALAAGARVLTTVGGPDKAKFVRELGADLVVDYRAGDFVDAVLDATGGEGVDAVFDSVGGDVMERSWRCIARNGRHLVLGFSGGIEAEDTGITLRPILFGNFSLVGVLFAYSAAPVQAKRFNGVNVVPRSVGDEVHARLAGLLEAGRIKPVVGQTVTFADLPQALERMEARKTIGRTVITL
jgi:NADPH2:quinone reductase